MRIGINCNLGEPSLKAAAALGFRDVMMWGLGSQRFEAPRFFGAPETPSPADPTIYINAAHAHGLNAIGVLQVRPPHKWFPDTLTLANPANVIREGGIAATTELNKWQFYVRAAVANNKGCTIWRVWNEPTDDDTYLPTGTYIEAVRQAAEVIHAAHGIVMAGPGDLFDPRAREIIEGVAPHVDILSFDYGMKAGPDNALRYQSRVKWLQRFGLPVWNVEFAPPPSVSWAQALRIHEDAGIDFLSVYYLWADSRSPLDPGNLWDATTNSLRPWAEPIVDAARRHN